MTDELLLHGSNPKNLSTSSPYRPALTCSTAAPASVSTMRATNPISKSCVVSDRRVSEKRPGVTGERVALCIVDSYPVSGGHSLVIPRHNVVHGLEVELHQPELNAVVQPPKERREQLSA